ncbi:uncharacterized protein CPUR_06323 [Claviceps purpurea 20.1]|uniref:Uncharacterized protein n=1 Tax=Claviceps purpurea (strain 20.1) TaxID=1111077 RepID=M1WDZ9_CLAP2|nr:uncharacterized protein CPUR_06323 [Claviceps purpurea 20.1]
MSRPSRIMERFVYQSEEASSSQPLTQSSFQPLTQTTLSSGLSSSLQLSSSPLPPTAREKGKGKARLKGDVYDVHLVPPFIHSSAGKERLSNNMSTFKYQGDVFVRDKVLDPMKYSKSTSIAWKYGEAVLKKDYPRSELKWYCYCCERDNRGQGLPGAPGGFKNRHLEDIHGYDKDTNTFRNIPRDNNNNNDAGVSKPPLRRTEIFRKQFHESWDQYPDTKALWVPEVQRLMLQVWDQEYRKIESTAPRATSIIFDDLEEDPIPMEQGVEFDTIQYWLRRRVTQPQLAKRQKLKEHQDFLERQTRNVRLRFMSLRVADARQY